MKELWGRLRREGGLAFRGGAGYRVGSGQAGAKRRKTIKGWAPRTPGCYGVPMRGKIDDGAMVTKPEKGKTETSNQILLATEATNQLQELRPEDKVEVLAVLKILEEGKEPAGIPLRVITEPHREWMVLPAGRRAIIFAR
jgi:ribosomal protein L15